MCVCVCVCVCVYVCPMRKDIRCCRPTVALRDSSSHTHIHTNRLYKHSHTHIHTHTNTQATTSSFLVYMFQVDQDGGMAVMMFFVSERWKKGWGGEGEERDKEGREK